VGSDPISEEACQNGGWGKGVANGTPSVEDVNVDKFVAGCMEEGHFYYRH
jgi:hypothetical protein